MSLDATEGRVLQKKIMKQEQWWAFVIFILCGLVYGDAEKGQAYLSHESDSLQLFEKSTLYSLMESHKLAITHSPSNSINQEVALKLANLEKLERLISLTFS